MPNKINVLLFAFVVLLCALCSCNYVDVSFPTCPTKFEGEAAAKKLDSLKQLLSVTDIAFFQNKLYLSTSSGILEYEDDQIQRVYKCRTAEWDTFEDLGLDHNTQQLWTYNYREFLLFQFDGANWTKHKVPALPDGKQYTRDDVNAGFVGVNYGGKYLLQNNDHMWSYDGGDNWTPFSLPKGRCTIGNLERSISRACFKGVTVAGGQLFVIFHGDYIGESIAKGDTARAEFVPQTDIIAYKQGEDWKIVNPNGTDSLFMDKMATTPSAFFVSTKLGKLFRINEAGIEPLESLGPIDALTVTSGGNLLACFRDKGIYELTGGWSKRSDLPFGQDAHLTVNILAEDNGTIVIAAGYAIKMEERTPADRVWILKSGRQMPIL